MDVSLVFTEIEHKLSKEKSMRLPSFEETLIYEVRSFYVPRPIYHGFLSNCSDGCCEYHVDVEYDWSIREWLTPSVLPWRKRKITPDEWKSGSHKSGGISNYTIGFQTHIIWECFVTLRYSIDAGYTVACRLKPNIKCWTDKVSRHLWHKKFLLIWNSLEEAPYPYIEELLFMKFLSKFARNGSLKTESIRVLKSFRTQGDTKYHEYDAHVTWTRLFDWRTPTSIQAQNFGFWCKNSMQIHLVFNYLEAIEHCKNMKSFVCKWFRTGHFHNWIPSNFAFCAQISSELYFFIGSPIRPNISILNLAGKENSSEYVDLKEIEIIFKERGEKLECLESGVNVTVKCANVTHESRKSSEQINWLWTGFQLINQTHFGNSQNQFIQGTFWIEQRASCEKYLSCRKSRNQLEFNNVRIFRSCYQDWVITDK